MYAGVCKMRKVWGYILLVAIYPAILVWRAFGGHWCSDESMELVMFIPFAGASWAWLRAKLHHRDKHPTCEHNHKD
jgi:hypothetical protein